MSFLNRLFGRNRSKPSPRQLLNALQAFITADTWAGSRRVVEEHPELLTDEADALMGQLIEGVLAQGNTDAARVFEEHRALLHRCREVGLEAAFAEKTGARGAQRAEVRTGIAVPPEFHDDLRRAQEAGARYRRTGDRQALDDAAAAWQRIWNHPSFNAAPSSFRLAALNDGAGVFWRRYWARGGIDDLSVALRCWEQAVAQTPEGSPDLPSRLNVTVHGVEYLDGKTFRSQCQSIAEVTQNV